MKTRGFILVFFSALTFSLTAQNVDDILNLIERNNTTLQASRQMAEAEKIANRTGLAPSNPAVDFAYLWGNPEAIGNRISFSVKQEFDFPSAYVYRNDMSKLKNEQAELNYEKTRQSILLETRLLCYELLYHNAVHAELEQRVQYAVKIVEAYKKSFDSGESNILEYNKAQLNLLNISKEIESNEAKRQLLLAKLATLNGGKHVPFSATDWPLDVIPVDFDEWYAQAETKNPMLAWLSKELELAKKEVRLNTANAAPKLNTGYNLDYAVGTQHQGIMVGISLPLWQDVNKVKCAKAKTVATENVLLDSKLQFYNQLKYMHTKATVLQKSFVDYREKIRDVINYEPLQNALDKGEISLIDYLMECTIYYDSYIKMLQLRKDAGVAYAEFAVYQ